MPAGDECLRTAVRAKFRLLAIAAAIFVEIAAVPAAAQEPPRVKVQAPENHVALKQTSAGGYFVAKPLKDEYDRLVSRLRLLKADIDSGRITGAAALKDLGELQIVLDALRAEIETKQVFVPIGQPQLQTATLEFELGPERCLLITADDVRVVGWDQPGVKCELEKTVLSADGKPDEAELTAIKLLHRHARDPEKVGRTLAEREANEQRFLATEAGQKLAPDARERRRKLSEDILRSWDHLRDFQGKEIDIVEISGLTYAQGNRSIGVEIGFDKGRSVSGKWRRNARLTVHVPQCNFVAIAGSGSQNLNCLDVQNVKASLVLSSSGTNKTGAGEPFQIRGLDGSLTVKQVPLDLIDGVTGNVNITSTVDLSGAGTRHGGGAIVLTREPPLACACKNIQGDFVAWFGSVDLQLEKIQGRIDVRNEFGDTKLAIAGKPSPAAHRIVSEAGRIELSVSRGAWADFPLWIATQSGTFRATAPPNFVENFSVRIRDAAGTQRSWVGLRRAGDQAAPPGQRMLQGLQALMDRLPTAQRGDERAAGFDLISRGGMIVIEAGP